MANKLFIVVNHDWFFLSHRKAIALAASDAGWNVTVVVGDTGRLDEIRGLGLKVIAMPINATGMNLKEELQTWWFLYKTYRREKPDIVHHVGLKTILWGGLAARISRVPSVVSAVSGLGVMFADDDLSVAARAVIVALRVAHRRAGVHVLFQNCEDRNLFIQHRIVKSEATSLIPGSGVDLDEFVYVPEPCDDVITVFFAARMVREKGVITLIEAAENLRRDYEGKVRFVLCGGLSANPNAIHKDELERLCDGCYVVWLGHRDDVRALLQKCHIVAFPSYYREGVPKTLIEACATGRPIVTTQSVGCKDTVDDGVNGYLVLPRDSRALAGRLRILIEDKTVRERMGLASRHKAECEFSIHTVVARHLEIYNSLQPRS